MVYCKQCTCKRIELLKPLNRVLTDPHSSALLHHMLIMRSSWTIAHVRTLTGHCGLCRSECQPRMKFTTAAVAAALLLAPHAHAGGKKGDVACGTKGAACCNSPANNINIGDCNTPDLACWEGICMTCGEDGKPACGGVNHLYASHLLQSAVSSEPGTVSLCCLPFQEPPVRRSAASSVGARPSPAYA